ncbi:hypothetical protein [Candidatus Reidiella endopervernicosa]|uniref:PAC domain-containing protein n=1 Tax=Candidatus Reidiella endopervernicosa TaxID=2738883 RepID=A0A6N0HUM5_9GAMM|nr:hypothetical protein [Candidatus Reidiella endopervernicosa]QKQ25947.1 hypothetical protein HUE57_06360 [Candidatus Reidiella endopervernicosa]
MGRPVIIAVARDVTLQKQEEQQLRDLLNHLSALYNATPDMIFCMQSMAL